MIINLDIYDAKDADNYCKFFYYNQLIFNVEVRIVFPKSIIYT